ncbi:MAG: sugar transferase [Alistipes sp.]|nr:sugar transferase [Alistipes sp.]
MNHQVVNRYEAENIGEYIHCYYYPDNEAWIAYGKSAYSLQNIVQDAGLQYIDRYSTDLEMASIMVGSKTIDKIFSTANIHTRQDKYVCIYNTTTIDNDEYSSWVQGIKNSSEKKNHQWIQTVVSNEIPKDAFIADGMSSFSRNTKRIVDFLAALVSLIIFSPLFLITYVMVRLEDGGPAIFKQERIGRFGRPFYIYKFRSMRIDAEKFGPQLSHSGGDNDPRLTKIGRFIRAHHLDELPQLWNVFCGDMSFIGPRPERKFYIDQIMDYDKRYVYLYQIRPGVTSYATLYNGYTDTMEKMLRRLEFDLYYLGHRSWWFDIKILINTFCAIVFGKKF